MLSSQYDIFVSEESDGLGIAYFGATQAEFDAGIGIDNHRSQFPFSQNPVRTEVNAQVTICAEILIENGIPIFSH
jgi:hypothetical protein